LKIPITEHWRGIGEGGNEMGGKREKYYKSQDQIAGESTHIGTGSD
jgi:hypothetical protein